MGKHSAPIERLFHDDYVDKKGKTIHSPYVGESTHAIIVSTNVIHVSKRCCQSSDKIRLSDHTPVDALRKLVTTAEPQKGKGFPRIDNRTRFPLNIVLAMWDAMCSRVRSSHAEGGNCISKCKCDG